MVYKKRRKKYKRRRYLILIGLLLSFYFLGKPLLQKISPPKVEHPKEPTKYAIPIFMYHYIEYVEDEEDTTRISLNIEPEKFEEQMKYLLNNGYTSISFSDFIKVLESEERSPTKAFVLTFDDGYESFYTYAFPLLKKYNLRAINFIVLNTLNYERHLKDWQIKEMFESGLVEFGAHSVSHIDLEKVLGDKLEREVRDSKDNLQSRIGVPIDFFSYPAGHYNDQVIGEVKKSVYKAAVAIEGNYPHTREDLFKLSRVRANKLRPEGLISFFKN